ncbi:hypothetical protein KB206_20730 [Microvirga sp. STS02]|uniref:hypothetical protein n=1 Tax=Hymenobacter negativus TaxID=2795026 RepID=UPI0018DC2D0E|nr:MULTISPECIES: hypothetical protein [Bacteria]MBH8571330.1 hypothetical protein [Hymenobacter negativus]MBR7211068.1 hypothetical protein [Microvirga sp. STS02]
MELEELQVHVCSALRVLHEHDDYLLTHGLHERSIAHKLANYLQLCFPELNVDCEYNGNCESENGRKVIYSLDNELNTIRSGAQQSNGSLPEDVEALRVYPDIIIHRRGQNAQNLLVIEIKKSSNRRHQNFDKKKLSAFTRSDCEFEFQFGLFLEIGTLEAVGRDRMIWYQNGSVL